MYNSCLETRLRFQNLRYFSKDLDQPLAYSVLSILHFSFYPGVDFSESLQPASLLWWNSLEFISTIPGFRDLSWAPVDDASADQQVIVLVQWGNQHSWKLFQSSLGFSIMLNYISSISNRYLQLALPVDISHFAY